MGVSFAYSYHSSYLLAHSVAAAIWVPRLHPWGGMAKVEGFFRCRDSCVSLDLEFAKKPRTLLVKEVSGGKHALHCLKRYWAFRRLSHGYHQGTLASTCPAQSRDLLPLQKPVRTVVLYRRAACSVTTTLFAQADPYHYVSVATHQKGSSELNVDPCATYLEAVVGVVESYYAKNPLEHASPDPVFAATASSDCWMVKA